ncbi:MAG: hypothetical protein ABSA63_00955 [Thermoplasmata archaeon]|jgi:hypothetical protein
MEKNSILGSPWRVALLRRLDTVLIVFELVLSGVFLSLSYLTGSLYLKGIGIGLVIAWVTSAIAYFFKRKLVKP